MHGALRTWWQSLDDSVKSALIEVSDGSNPAEYQRALKLAILGVGPPWSIGIRVSPKGVAPGRRLQALLDRERSRLNKPGP